MKTFSRLSSEICAELRAADIASPEAEAKFIAEAAGEKRFFQLMTEPVSPEAQAKADAIVARRRKKEPLQYILESAPFRELDLYVTPDVLIPRPETEMLVSFCLDALPENGTLLDLGTGSGAIALSVGFERRDAKVTAVDISGNALAVARKNAAKYALTDRVEFLLSDLFSAVKGRRFDVIAANLPYVTLEEYPTLDAEVRDFEPQLALTSPDAGLQHIKRAVSHLKQHLNPGGDAFFELSPPQAETVAGLLSRAGFSSKIHPDLTGRARFVAAKNDG